MSKGDLYTPTGEKLSDVFNNFYTAASKLPIFSAGKNFFTFNGSGSCPVWDTPSMPMPLGGVFPSLHVDMFCSTTAMNIYPLIKAVLLAVAAVYAFKIAIVF